MSSYYYGNNFRQAEAMKKFSEYLDHTFRTTEPLSKTLKYNC